MSVLFVNMALPHNVYEAAQAVQKAYEVIYETVRRFKGGYIPHDNPTCASTLDQRTALKALPGEYVDRDAVLNVYYS